MPDSKFFFKAVSMNELCLRRGILKTRDFCQENIWWMSFFFFLPFFLFLLNRHRRRSASFQCRKSNCDSHKTENPMAVIFICGLLPCPHVSGEWTTLLYVCAVAQFCQAKNCEQRLITNRCANPTQQNHLHQPSLMNERILLQMGNEKKKRWKPNIWNEWTALPWQFWSCELSHLGASYWFGIMTFK